MKPKRKPRKPKGFYLNKQGPSFVRIMKPASKAFPLHFIEVGPFGGLTVLLCTEDTKRLHAWLGKYLEWREGLKK